MKAYKILRWVGKFGDAVAKLEATPVDLCIAITLKLFILAANKVCF